jgi:DNA-directed RNA polymerase subunit RPC12/RpoP
MGSRDKLFIWPEFRRVDWVMGWPDYPDNWNKIRRKVLKRDGYKCTNCGVHTREAELHVHHITPISEGGTHSLPNLTTLCYSCHNNEHSHRIPRAGEFKTKQEVPECLLGKGPYKCARCKRCFSISEQGLKCSYCGYKVALKMRSSEVRRVNVN